MIPVDRIANCRLSVLALTVSILLFVPGFASAQSGSDLEAVKGKIRPGETVRVTDTNGKRITARLDSISGDSLHLIRGRKPLDKPTESIELIERQRPDPLWNGAVIGAAPGLFFLLLASGNNCDYEGTNSYCVLGAVGAAFGAGVGAAVDSSKHRYDVMYRSSTRRRARFEAAPFLSKDNRGVALNFSF